MRINTYSMSCEGLVPLFAPGCCSSVLAGFWLSSSPFFSCARARLAAMTRFLRSWAQLAGAYPRAYLLSCLIAGLVLRWWVSGGDWLRFLDPRFPLNLWLF